MKKKIYIAGKVTGEKKEDCKAKFAQAQSSIEALGFEAVNPLVVVGGFNTKWENAMRSCIAVLMHCHAIILLPDWQFSQGAILEKELAMKLGIPVFEANFFGFEKLEQVIWNN